MPSCSLNNPASSEDHTLIKSLFDVYLWVMGRNTADSCFLVCELPIRQKYQVEHPCDIHNLILLTMHTELHFIFQIEHQGRARSVRIFIYIREKINSKAV